MCLNESYTKVRAGKTIPTHFLLWMVQKKETLHHHRFLHFAVKYETPTTLPQAE